MTGDSELEGLGRRKENAQKVAMRSKGGNQLGLQAQWHKGTGRKHGHDLRGCRENSVIRGQSGFCEHKSEGGI